VILKDTILSTERVALAAGGAVIAGGSAVAGSGSVIATIGSVIAGGGSAIRIAEPLAAESPDPVPGPPPEPPLDFEAVADWLCGQDETTRVRVATLLADEIEALRAAALAEGTEQGRAEAMTRVREDMATAVTTLEALSQAAEAAFVRETQQLADQCTAIVAEALAHIAGPVLTSREATLGVVTTLLARLKDEREIVVRTSEADLPLLQSELPALRAAASGHAVSLVADRRVALGGCIVDTKLGSLDGRLETQLAGLFETLRALRTAGEAP